MKIGELSRRSGVSPRSLRYYEEHSLIAAGRAENGYRVYGDEVVEQARNVHLMFGLGVDRELARSVLACSGSVSPDVHRATRDQLAAVRDQMEERIAEITEAHASLSAIIERLSPAEPDSGA